MKRKIIAFLIFAAVTSVFVAKLSSKPESAKDDVFTIMTFGGAHPFGVMASAFDAAYTGDKTIEILYYDISMNSEQTAEEYKSDLTNMLMTGNGPDVYYLPDEMLLSMGRSNYAADLYEFMNNDPEFDENKYYMNVVEAFEQRGKLPVIPVSYNNFYMGINREFADKTEPDFNTLNTVSITDMLDIYKSLSLEERELYQIEENMKLSKAFMKTEYLDIKSQSANFLDESFIDTADDFKNYNIDIDQSSYGRFTASYVSGDDPAYESLLFGLFSDNLPFQFLPYKSPYSEGGSDVSPGWQGLSTKIGPTERFTHIIPFTTNDGRQIIRSRSLVAINANSEDKDLAWEFIKFTIDKYIPPAFGSFENSISRDMSRQALEDSYKVYIDDAVKVPITEEMEKDFAATTEFLLKTADGPKFAMYEYPPATLESVLDNYMLTDQTAYDLAVYMQNMMTTFFEERD